MSKRVKIAQFGLGPIGLETVKLASTKAWAEVVGGIDNAPEKAGRDLGELTGTRGLRGRHVYASLEQLLEDAKPDVLLHTAVSRFRAAYPQLEPIVGHGINVVSSCEELLFPRLREPRLASRLDRLCQRSGTRVVATGVNPGFVMDVLAVCLTGVCRQVRAVHVQRVVNASTRREPLQRKIGSRLPPAEFNRRFRQGRAGHAGLKESLALIAYSLGWKATQLLETCEPVVAQRLIRTRFLEVQPGQTCGLHQRAQARVDGEIRLSLDLKMHLDAPDPHDHIQIEGDPPLDLRLQGGVAGDEATVAALINTAPRLLRARPGLRLMTELPVPCVA